MKHITLFIFLLAAIPYSPFSQGVAQAITDLAANMVNVPGGTFTMGCTSEQGDDCDKEEKPSHSVTLSSFYICRFEVTQDLWQAVMGNNPSSNKGCGTCPVEQVSWTVVQEFLVKLNKKTGKTYRLPTEAEWEYAARGGKSGGTKFAGSDDPGKVGWYNGDEKQTVGWIGSPLQGKTQPVGQKAANGLGLYDMTGNVWEWCSDWHTFNYYKESPSNNPKGPSFGGSKVIRGGSYANGASFCRVSSRNRMSPKSDMSGNTVGFRLAMTN